MSVSVHDGRYGNPAHRKPYLLTHSREILDRNSSGLYLVLLICTYSCRLESNFGTNHTKEEFCRQETGLWMSVSLLRGLQRTLSPARDNPTRPTSVRPPSTVPVVSGPTLARVLWTVPVDNLQLTVGQRVDPVRIPSPMTVRGLCGLKMCTNTTIQKRLQRGKRTSRKEGKDTHLSLSRKFSVKYQGGRN